MAGALKDYWAIGGRRKPELTDLGCVKICLGVLRSTAATRHQEEAIEVYTESHETFWKVYLARNDGRPNDDVYLDHFGSNYLATALKSGPF